MTLAPALPMIVSPPWLAYDILEVEDGLRVTTRYDCLAGREIDGDDAAASESNLTVVDGVGPSAAVVVVEVHGVIVDDPIVAVAGIDRVGAALRIDHIGAAGIRR